MRSGISDGQPTIAACDVGASPDFPLQEAQTLMRAEMVTTRFETAQAEDVGNIRLPVFHGSRRMRPTCAEDETVRTTPCVTMERP